MSFGTTHANEGNLNVVDEQRAWFEDVYQKHYALVYGFLRARLLDPNDTDDLCQEVFLRCYETRDRFDPSRSEDARSWLHGIGRNVLYEHMRRIKRRKEIYWIELTLELDDLVGLDELEDDRLQQLPICMEQLGESASQAIRAHYMRGMKLKDIADQTGRTLGAIKVLMVRARQALFRCIQQRLKQKKQP